MNKKVLLSVLSAGLLATTVAPLALAQGENASNSNQLTQKNTFLNATSLTKQMLK